VQPTEANLTAGAKIYRDYCVFCHGTIDGPKTAAAAGMFPPPRQLLQDKGVTDDPVGDHFVVKELNAGTGNYDFDLGRQKVFEWARKIIK
jgi:hypothetical protein